MLFFLFIPLLTLFFGGCLCDSWKPSFLPLLIFDWRTFSRQVTARWWRQSAKDEVSTNQNSRNRWYLIVRRTICLQCRKMVRDTLKILQHLLQDFKSVSNHFTTLRSKELISNSFNHWADLVYHCNHCHF